MSKTNPIVPFLSFLLYLLLFINILILPIGLVVSNEKVLNQILDNISFEQKFLSLYTQNTVDQVQEINKEISEEELLALKEDVGNQLTSEKELRKQRVTLLSTLFKSFKDGNVPEFEINLLNPLGKIQKGLSEKTNNILDKIKDIKICSDFIINLLPDSAKDPGSECTTINDYFASDSSDNTPILKSDSFVIKTNLGITETNISQISTIYRFIIYTPYLLLILSAGLLITILILTYKNEEYFSIGIKRMLIITLVSLSLWLLTAYFFKTFQPITFSKLDETSLNGIFISTQENVLKQLQTLINSILGSFAIEVVKRSYIVPLTVIIPSLLSISIKWIIEKKKTT